MCITGTAPPATPCDSTLHDHGHFENYRAGRCALACVEVALALMARLEQALHKRTSLLPAGFQGPCQPPGIIGMFRDPCSLVRGRRLSAVSSSQAPNVASPHPSLIGSNRAQLFRACHSVIDRVFLGSLCCGPYRLTLGSRPATMSHLLLQGGTLAGGEAIVDTAAAQSGQGTFAHQSAVFQLARSAPILHTRAHCPEVEFKPFRRQRLGSRVIDLTI